MFITFEAEITPNGLIKIPEEYRQATAQKNIRRAIKWQPLI